MVEEKIMMILPLALFVAAAQAAPLSQLEAGKAAIESMQGCFLVDYSYAETQALKPGYQLDGRVYDVNKTSSVKEWIYAEHVSPTRIRLQHVLFAADLDGKVVEESFLKHTGEDWEYNANSIYDFTRPQFWDVKAVAAELWTRKITNLDDGLRYQCSAAWDQSKAFAEWSCNDNFAPIPGRETRDMGRKDYNTLLRGTRLVMYGASWLERQDNVKTIYENNQRTPLAREVGKNWYVRLPDADCAKAVEFAAPRRAFWSVLREAWDEVLVLDRPFEEKTVPGQSRYGKVMALEAQYMRQDMRNPVTRQAAKNAILAIIAEFRR